MKEEKIILNTDPEAAKQATITGWVSSTGRFFKDQDAAIYDGCTHKKCECGNLMLKYWTKCETCRSRAAKERYYSLPVKDWDEKAMVYSYGADEFFLTKSDIEDYLNDNDIEAGDLRLVLCKPIYPSTIDADYWDDQLSEEGDLPKELLLKLENFNNFISKLGPLSWEPSNVRIEYKP